MAGGGTTQLGRYKTRPDGAQKAVTRWSVAVAAMRLMMFSRLSEAAGSSNRDGGIGWCDIVVNSAPPNSMGCATPHDGLDFKIEGV